jgi:hypothetical protein
MVTRGATQVAQVKVSWTELPHDLATWEDYTMLKQAFPRVLACWGQQAFKSWGMSVVLEIFKGEDGTFK